MESKEFQYLAFLFSIAFLAIIVLLFVLINYIQKKRTQFLLDKERARAEYEEQLLQTKIEITEQNLKNIAQELHDNIGQILSVASLEMKMLLMKPTEKPEELKEVSELISQSIEQIRALSKSLNSDSLKANGLEKSISSELVRLEKLGLIKTNFSYDCNSEIEPNQAMVIFRIIQEFISNTLKHANASKLKISILEKANNLFVELTDDGIGFNSETVTKNNGLINIESRTKLLNAEVSYNSEVKKGTKLNLKIPLDGKS